MDRDNRELRALKPAILSCARKAGRNRSTTSASENMPVDVLLLLDVSASMRPHIERIASAAHDAFRALRPEDRVGIMVFDRSTGLGCRSGAANRTWSASSNLCFARKISVAARISPADARRRRLCRTRGAARRAPCHRHRDRRSDRVNRDEDAVSHALVHADAVLSALIAPDAMRNRSGHSGGRREPGVGRSRRPARIIFGGGGPAFGPAQADGWGRTLNRPEPPKSPAARAE